MPKTIIKAKTWSCPECEYHQDFEPTAELMLKHFGRSSDACPSCGKASLQKETRPEKKCVVTIMGEEDIEPEIQQLKGDRAKRQEDGMSVDELPDLTTKAKESAYRTKRKKDIQDAIKVADALADN